MPIQSFDGGDLTTFLNDQILYFGENIMPTVCGVNQIDSNVTGLSFAEEDCPKILPGVNGVDAVWRALEPNSYSDFGGDLKTVARTPINASRQQKKGTVTDLDASGGFNTDVTHTNTLRLMQGFFFANARQKTSTQPFNGNQVAISSITSKKFATASAAGFAVGSIIVAKGFGVTAIDGKPFTVSASDATGVTVNEAVPDTANVPTTARLETAGAVVAGVVLSVANGLTAVGGTAIVPASVIPGEWVFISAATNVGYARVNTISADLTTVTFDRTTFTPVAAASGSVSFYFGTVLRSESDPTLITKRSYQFERTLGNDAAGVQSEYLPGSFANTFTLNIPSADKLNADLAFVSLNNEQRSGLTGLKPGTRKAAPGEDAYNTSSDIYRIRMTLGSDTDANPQPLFGYISEGSLTINNNITASKAVGTLGAFDVSAGNFEATGSVTAYFTTVAATQAVRANADVGIYAIIAARNSGVIYDLPLVQLGGGRITVEKDKPVMVPLTPTGAQSKFGHTMAMVTFPYLPDAAMPVAT